MIRDLLTRRWRWSRALDQIVWTTTGAVLGGVIVFIGTVIYLGGDWL